MTVNNEVLDADELLHLAMEASKKQDSEAAIKYLKSAREQSPESSEVQFMLGATYADLGMFDRAETSLKEAVTLKPDFEAAIFQLGLLYIVNNRIDNAAEAWEALDTKGEENPYYLFKSGLLKLANDEFDQSIEYINKGLQANQENEPLNINMSRILNDILASQQQSEANSVTPQNTRQTQLKAYQNSDD
jgi:tetratricopeptide (TPR) repeat protein